MTVETMTTYKLVATKEEKQAMKDGMKVLNALDDVTNDSGSCDRCPLAKMCDRAPSEIGCLIHFSQKIFDILIENT